jgi:signal transduction histidine kinase
VVRKALVNAVRHGEATTVQVGIAGGRSFGLGAFTKLR